MRPELASTIREWHRTSEGWMEFERMMEMAQLILDTGPSVVCELGVFGGRSFITQALALKENGHGKIYGVDPWKLEKAIEGENDANVNWWKNNVDLNVIHQYCVNALWKYELDKHATIIRSASQDCYELFKKIDILNVDGNHSEVASCRDVTLYLPMVKPGGYVWFDDCDWATTKAAQNWLEDACEIVKVSPDGHYKLYRKR